MDTFKETDLEAIVGGERSLAEGLGARWIDSEGIKATRRSLPDEIWKHPQDIALPFPFTLVQFRAFCDWHPTFEWEAVIGPFTNDDGTLDEAALTELATRGADAAQLLRQVLGAKSDKSDWTETKSPRDFRPWESLDFLPDGCFLYQQAAREIADSLSWSDAKLEALLETMAEAINSKALPTVSRKTGLRLTMSNAPEFLGVVNVADVNEWLKENGATYLWTRDGQGLSSHNNVRANEIQNILHTTKEKRRYALDPEIELAQSQCKDPNDIAAVWGALQKLAEKTHGQLLGATEDGIQYLKNGAAAIFTRDALQKRLKKRIERLADKRR